jgi:hypothetical protein
MTGHLGDHLRPADKGRIMCELTGCIAAAIDADLAHLYLVETDGQLVRFPGKGEGPGGRAVQAIRPGGSVAAFCAHAKDVVGGRGRGAGPLGRCGPPTPARMPGSLMECWDWRWGRTMGNDCTAVQGNARILCHPICSGVQELEAVVEFVRIHGNAFTEEEIEKVNSYLVWGGPSLFYADKIAKLNQEK